MAVDNSPEIDWSDGDAVNKMDPENFAVALTAKLSDAPATLTCAQMDEIEQHWRDTMPARRCALIMITKSFAWLRDSVQEDREFALSVADTMQCATAALSSYKATIKLLENATLRASVALAYREDMAEILDEVEADRTNSSALGRFGPELVK